MTLSNEELINILDVYEHHGKSSRKAAESLNMPVRTFGYQLTKARQLGIKDKKIIHGIIIPDAHNHPKLSLERFSWLASYVNDVEPDFLLDIGDFDDFESLCSQVKNESYSGRFKPSFQADLEQATAARQLLHEEIRVPIEKLSVRGNHEHRMWLFEEKNPEIYGMMQHSYLDMLSRYGWNQSPYGEYLDIGGVDFVHTPLNIMGRPLGGKRVDVNVAVQSIKDVAFGHTHAMNVHRELKLGPQRSTTAFNVGCYMPEGYIADYAKNTMAHYWRGLHTVRIEDNRLHIEESITISMLKKRYG